MTTPEFTAVEKLFLRRTGEVCVEALTDLRKSGISDETILKSGVKLFHGKADDLKKKLGFARINDLDLLQTTNLVEFPYYKEDGSIELSRFKPVPQIDSEMKYLQPKGRDAIPYILPETWAVKEKTTVPLWITEGEKKALKITQSGRHCIALSGVWNFKAGKNSNASVESKELWPQIKEFAMSGRSVFLAFDSDIYTNKQVRFGVIELAVKLISLGAVVRFVYWSVGKGIDDFLVTQENPEAALIGLERGGLAFETFVKPDYQTEVIRAIAVTHLAPVSYERLVAAAAKCLNVRPTIVKAQIREFQSKHSTTGGIDEFFKRFLLIKGEEKVIDREQGRIMSVPALILDCPSVGKVWKDSDQKETIEMSKIVFKPQGAAKDEINLFRGLDLTPGDAPCTKILELIDHLCQGDEGLKHWLTCWLAYPLQNLGAKMKTTLVVQGIQGSGKSKLFEEVMREVYTREYFSFVTQEQIEEKFNEWMSHKLFICCDEVIANKNLGKVKNLLKSYITQPTVNIRKMREPARSEENHANFVFLSNEDVPVLLDSDDRRNVVISVDKKVSVDLMIGVDQELANGGARGFIKYLLSYDCGDFNEFAPAYGTEGKDRLKMLCEKAPEKFLKAWQAGELDFPYCCCEKTDLFTAFKLWVDFSGEYGDAAWDKFNGKIQTLINREIITGIRDGKINAPTPGEDEEVAAGRKSVRAWKVDLSDEVKDAWFPQLFQPSQAVQVETFKKSVESYKKMVAASRPY